MSSSYLKAIFLLCMKLTWRVESTILSDIDLSDTSQMIFGTDQSTASPNISPTFSAPFCVAFGYDCFSMKTCNLTAELYPGMNQSQVPLCIQGNVTANVNFNQLVPQLELIFPTASVTVPDQDGNCPCSNCNCTNNPLSGCMASQTPGVIDPSPGNQTTGTTGVCVNLSPDRSCLGLKICGLDRNMILGNRITASPVPYICFQGSQGNVTFNPAMAQDTVNDLLIVLSDFEIDPSCSCSVCPQRCKSAPISCPPGSYPRTTMIPTTSESFSTTTPTTSSSCPTTTLTPTTSGACPTTTMTSTTYGCRKSHH